MTTLSRSSILAVMTVGLAWLPDSLGAQGLHELAHSERLALKYFVVIPQGTGRWCGPQVIMQVQADSKKFLPNPDFLSLTQRAGKLLGQECSQATVATIVVTDAAQSSSKPLWTGSLSRANGWMPLVTPASGGGCKPAELDCVQARSSAGTSLPERTSAPVGPTVTPIAPRPDRNFVGQDLSNQDRNTSSLDGANFSGASLRSTNLANSRIRNANFQDADLRGAYLGGSDLSGSDLRGAALPFILSGGIKMQGVNMEGLDLKGQGFFWVDLTGANLRNTKNFGTVESTNFTNADLRGANLLTAWTNARTPTLSAANFKGAIYDNDTVFPKGFSPQGAGMVMGQTAPSTPMSQANVGTVPAAPASSRSAAEATQLATSGRPGRSFYGQKLPDKSAFQNENLRNANFEGADLNGANFQGALLENANFRNADLRYASFRGANLTAADFTGATLDIAKTPRWVGAQLVGAKLSNLEFMLVGCDNYYNPAFFELASTRVLAMIADRSNGGMSFRNADLTNSKICGDMSGVDFRGADLRGADLAKVTGLNDALMGGAKYDSQTKLPGNPSDFRMVRAPDLTPAKAPTASGPVNSVVGEWWISKVRPGERDTPHLGFLGLDPQGKFEWSPGDDDAKLLYGQWQQTPQGVLLKSGEGGKDWIVALTVGRSENETVLIISSTDGKQKRTAVRKVAVKN